jgi:tRNA pseudouridine55 synthase
VNLDGLLLVDKPTNMTSHDVVGSLRKILRHKRIGHTGTLDPIATGLMIMVIGEATKLSDYLMAEDKAYTVDIRLGVRTDTLDREGAVVESKPVNISREYLESMITDLTGEFDWAVPAYSAAKVDGRPLHEMARKNIAFEAPVKTMRFWDLELVSFSGDRLTVAMNCSKGSFVRTWVDQLGQKLGTGAMVEELRRTRVGIWSLERAVSLTALAERQVETIADLGSAFVLLPDSLPGFRSIVADEREARLMNNGQIANSLAGRLVPEQKQAFDSGRPVYVKVSMGSGRLLALVGAEPGQGLKIRRVFRDGP